VADLGRGRERREGEEEWREGEGDEGRERERKGGREDKEGNTEKCIPVEVMVSIHTKKLHCESGMYMF